MGHQSHRQKCRRPTHQRKAGEYQNQHRQTIPAHLRQGFYVTAEKVKNAWQGLGDGYQLLLHTFDEYLNDFEKNRVGKDRKASTQENYRKQYRRLAAFLQYEYYITRSIWLAVWIDSRVPITPQLHGIECGNFSEIRPSEI